MPRSTNLAYVPKYRKHRDSGQAIVTINGRDYRSHRRFAVLARHWIRSSTAKKSRAHEQSVSNAFAFSAAGLTMRPKLSED